MCVCARTTILGGGDKQKVNLKRDAPPGHKSKLRRKLFDCLITTITTEVVRSQESTSLAITRSSMFLSIQ